MPAKKSTKKTRKKSISYEDDDVYRDLKQQLIRNNNYSAYTEAMLQQYMKFCENEELLNKDIEVRGVTVYWNNGGGQDGWKKNESLTELNRTNLQKIKLLQFLGIKAPDPKARDGDDEDYEV